jgi:hypothetical protein
MRPPLWHPAIELSSKEQKVVKHIKKAKLFIFLREVRRELWLSRTCSDKKISLMIRKACCLRLAGWVKVRSSTY